MTHLPWQCKLKGYLCYICRTSFQVRLGCIQWPGSDCVRHMAVQRIAHPNFNPSTLANDIALLRLQPPVTFTSKYPSPVLTCVVVCAVRPHVIGGTMLWLLHILAIDTNMIDFVTHSDKVIVTKCGQQLGPSLSTMGGGGLLSIISKGKCSCESRKFSIILYLLN